MSQTRITKEAARDIWQTLCQKAVAADQDLYYERVSRFLHSKLEELSEETGQDMSLPLGQFLVSEGEDEGAKVSGVPTGAKARKFLVCSVDDLFHVWSHVLSGKSNPLSVDLLNLIILKSLGAGERDFPGIDAGDDDLHGLLKGQVFLVI